MTDYYRDTDERYKNDPAFHGAVQMLMHVAREHGFTPGELKQIAFKAALNIEIMNPRPVTVARSICECCGGVADRLTSYIHLGRVVCSEGCYQKMGGGSR